MLSKKLHPEEPEQEALRDHGIMSVLSAKSNILKPNDLNSKHDTLNLNSKPQSPQKKLTPETPKP